MILPGFILVRLTDQAGKTGTRCQTKGILPEGIFLTGGRGSLADKPAKQVFHRTVKVIQALIHGRERFDQRGKIGFSLFVHCGSRREAGFKPADNLHGIGRGKVRQTGIRNGRHFFHGYPFLPQDRQRREHHYKRIFLRRKYNKNRIEKQWQPKRSGKNKNGVDRSAVKGYNSGQSCDGEDCGKPVIRDAAVGASREKDPQSVTPEPEGRKVWAE